MRVVLLGLALAFAMPALSVAQGANDVTEGKKLFTGLCVTCHGFVEVGRRCVQGLLEQIRDTRVRPGTVLVPTTLVERASTAPPPPE